MTQVTQAVYSDGVLKPETTLVLREQERVRLVVQSLDRPDENDRSRAVEELRADVARMNFRSKGPYPTRDELHERG